MILWICPSGILASIREKQLGHPKQVHFISPGEAVGQQFDEVIIDGSLDYTDHRVRDWLKDSIQCRLVPGAKGIKEIVPYMGFL